MGAKVLIPQDIADVDGKVPGIPGLMKATANSINAARGALVDEAALIEVLQKRRIAGAGSNAH
jgi:hypothetical protein